MWNDLCEAVSIIGSETTDDGEFSVHKLFPQYASGIHASNLRKSPSEAMLKVPDFLTSL